MNLLTTRSASSLESTEVTEGDPNTLHESQLLSYLKLADCKIGLLINFNVKYLKEGIRRMKL
jgi:GxxExxY protein